LLAATILLAASIVSIVAFQRAGFGSVLGLLATGIVVGPSGLAITADVETFRSVTELGVVLLLFIIGLEMEPKRLWAMRRLVFGMGMAQVALTAGVLWLSAIAFGQDGRTAIVVSTGLALSSTAFVIQILDERGERASRHGEASFGILLFQDLMVVPLLMLVSLLGNAPSTGETSMSAHTLTALAMLAAVIVAGRFVMPAALAYVAHHRHSEAFTGLALLSVALAALLMDHAGLSMPLGAFLMGMLLSRSRFHHQLEADVAPFKGILLSLFFISVGMSVDLASLSDNLVAIALGVLTVITVKFACILAVARMFGFDRADSMRIAGLLPQGGEFGFVLFGAARAAGLLDSGGFVEVILVISTSMAMTPLITGLIDARLRRAGPTGPAIPDSLPRMDRHVILCGYGRAGRTVGAMLETAGHSFVAIDYDPLRVERGQASGAAVIYGNATDRKLLDMAGIGRAAAVVVTLDRPEAAGRVISAIRNFHPEVPLIARAPDLRTREAMLVAGVSHVVPEAVEMSLALGEATLRNIGIEDDRVGNIAGLLRADDYADLRHSEQRTS